MNLKSSQISVYPTAVRNDNFDRNARLNSEYNITNLINRLTGRDAFIISGFSNLSIGGDLDPGEFNINGYYFKIPEMVNIEEILTGATEGDTINLTITIEEMKVDAVTEIVFKQLKGFDTTNDMETSLYTGLAVTKETNGSLYPANNSLPIFVYKGGNWKPIPSSRLSFDLDQIAVTNYDPNSLTKLMKNAGLSQNTTDAIIPLNDWLINDFIIDDGEI